MQGHKTKYDSFDTMKTTQTKGIMFNCIIKKSTINEVKPVIEDKQNLTTTDSADAQNNHLAVDDDNLVSNKMYKIVLVDGKLMLAEHTGDDTVEEHVEKINESNQKLVDVDNDEECNENNNDTLTKNVIGHDKKNLPVSFPTVTLNNIVDKVHDYYPTPKIENQDFNKPKPIKTYTHKRNMNSNENLMPTSNKGSNFSNSNLYTTKNHLADARKKERKKKKEKTFIQSHDERYTNVWYRGGKAMVLVPLKKYTSLKKKLLETQAKEEARKCEEVEVKMSKRTVAIQTHKYVEETRQELKDLRAFHTKFSQIFTDAQIHMMMGLRKSKDIQWSDAEVQRVIFLKQIISQTTYLFLKYKMHFPLPPLSDVKRWMGERKQHMKPKKTPNHVKPTIHSSVAVQEITLTQDANIINVQTQDNHINKHTIQNQNEYQHTTQNQNLDPETTQAINPIMDHQTEYMDGGRYIGAHDVVMSTPAVSGEEFVLYTYDNNQQPTINSKLESGYMQNDSIVSTVEIAQSQVKTKRKRSLKNQTSKCCLCMCPFETNELLRQHVARHYQNSWCTSYLDATKPYICVFCNEVVKHRSQLVRHHRTHLGIDPLKCWRPGCTYIGQNEENLKSHYISHKTPTFKCEQCPAMFKTRKYMREHCQRRHAARASLRCELCRTDYTFRRHVRSHSRPPRGVITTTTAHTVTQHRIRHLMSHCGKCLRLFDDCGEYYTHRAQHKRARVECACACGDRFDGQDKLVEHKLQCPFLSADNNESTKCKKQGRKRKNVDKTTDQDDNSNNDRPKRKNKFEAVQQTIAGEESVAQPEKTSRVNVIIGKREVIKLSDSDRHKVTAVSEDPHTQVSTLRVIEQLNQVLPKKYVLKVLARPDNITAVSAGHTQNFIAVTNNDTLRFLKLRKVDALPANYQQKVIALPANPQQNVIALPTNRQQKVIALTANPQQKVIALPANPQQKVIALPTNPQQKVIALLTNPLQKVITLPANPQQKVIALPTNPQQKNHVIPANPQQKLIAVPANPQQKVIALPADQQENAIAVADNRKRNVISLPENHPPKIIVRPDNQMSHIYNGNQRKQKKISPNEQILKNINSACRGRPVKKKKY